MWWPRPRWKGDLFTNFILPLVITIAATTDTAMADEGQQHCGDNDMSAVVWTTALCTMLFVLVMIAIYFVYCKKRKHDWSSLWWKNNSDKNIMLQTSSPAKEKSQIHGGTDNLAFLADNNVVGRIVHVPLSTVDVGSIGIELSEVDGKQIYTCKQKDGSIDHLIAMRLVFDKKQQQQHVRSSLDLNRALAELSRKYGLRVELETEGKLVGDRCGGDIDRDDDTAKCAKSNNLLSAVCGKAQRMWNHQKQFVLKGGENHGCVHASAGDDVEGGRSDAPVQKTAATVVVAVIDETPRKGDGSLRRYNTLEYGASSAATDDGAPVVELSLDRRHCTIDALEPVAATVVAADGGSDVNTTKITAGSDVNTTKITAGSDVNTTKITAGSDVNTTKITIGSDDEPAAAKWDEPTKHASVNPPPPPPRKYSAPVVPATVAGIVPRVADTRPVLTPDKTSDKPSARDEIRVDDDYYWCTTTAMATPSPTMSTFGKGPSSATAADGNNGNDVSGEMFDGGETAVSSSSSSSLALRRGDGDGTTVVQMTDDVDDCGGTTSIEDASLPSFPSDEDEDDECAPPSPQNGNAAVQPAPHAATESKSPTKLPTLRLSLSTPPSGTSAVASCDSSSSITTSTSSSSSSSTNSGHNNSGLPIVSKIPVRRQSAGSGFAVNFTTCTNNGTAKKSIPYPLSKSTSRLAM